THVVASRIVPLPKLHASRRDGLGAARAHNRQEVHQRVMTSVSFGIFRAAFVRAIRPLKSCARVSRPSGISQVARVSTVPQLECVAEEQTGAIMSRLVAGQAWACLAGARAHA